MSQPQPQGQPQSDAGLPPAQCSAEAGEKTQTANKWVWYIATLAMELWAAGKRREPAVGDMVVETTHLIGLARHKLGLECAVGELMEITTGDCGKKYLIKTLSGELQYWENCLLVPLDKPNAPGERPEKPT